MLMDIVRDLALQDALYLGAGLLVFEGLQRVWPKAQHDPRRRLVHELAGVTMLVTMTAVTYVFYMLLRGGIARTIGFHAPFTLIHSTAWWSSAARVALVILVEDFSLYWVHRLQHTRLGWRNHYLHHLPSHLSWTSGFYCTPIHLILMFLPSTVLGWMISLSAGEIAAWTYWAVFNQHFIHSSFRLPRRGPIQWFGNSEFHFIHHTTSPDIIDKNFGFSLTLWDRLFGTYVNPATVPSVIPLGSPFELRNLTLANWLGLRAPDADAIAPAAIATPRAA
jgi:sterol desaturase/sphingolipid hydroxylase (fatty acid hydroxylase superfamily)